MKTLLAALLLTVSAGAYAGTAFFKYEINDNGMTKICVYEYLGNLRSITIKSYQFCPYTIQTS